MRLESDLGNIKGTSRSLFNNWPDFPPYDGLETSLATEQYISNKTLMEPWNLIGVLTPPHLSCIDFPSGYPDTGIALLWQYEHLRQICKELNLLIVRLKDDLKNPCNGDKCYEMSIENNTFMCAAHSPPESCSALLYCIHTLDSAISVLTSTKNFPSRNSLTLVSGTLKKNKKTHNETFNPIEEATVNLSNVARRLSRIFFHAYHSHREIFMEFEFGKDYKNKIEINDNINDNWISNLNKGHYLYSRFSILVYGGELKTIFNKYYNSKFDQILIDFKTNYINHQLNINKLNQNDINNYLDDLLINLNCQFENLIPIDTFLIPFGPLI